MGVVEPGGLEAFKELVGALEVHAVTPADSRMAQGGGEESLVDSCNWLR